MCGARGVVCGSAVARCHFGDSLAPPRLTRFGEREQSATLIVLRGLHVGVRMHLSSARRQSRSDRG